MSVEVVDTGAAPPVTEPEWDLASQWARAWRILRWIFAGLAALGFLMIIGQGFLFYRMFADIHPWLGLGFVIVLATALSLLVGRPLASFFATPVMARPPAALKTPGAPSRAEVVARARYAVRYLKGLGGNPEIDTAEAAFDADLQRGRALVARATTGADTPLAMAREIETFERDVIEARLKDLDARVDAIIRAEAVGVGVATAISVNGTVDAFIVLWRNANLVSRIARMYFGRPHLAGSLMILRDVAAIVVLSRALEDVTDITGEVIGGLLGRMGGLVAGPVMDGAVNAMMTLKLGHLAKARCRSFEAWTASEAPAISASALERVKRDSASVAADLLKRCGGLTSTAARAAEGVMQGSKSAWSMIQSWFGPKPAPSGARPGE